MTVIAILMSVTCSSLTKMCTSREKTLARHVPLLPTRAANQDFSSIDPFSDVANVSTPTPQADDARITTKFVEIYSGTDELSFDWIVPFEQSTSKE